MSRRRGLKNGKSNEQNAARYGFSQAMKAIKMNDYEKYQKTLSLVSHFCHIDECGLCEKNEFERCLCINEEERRSYCMYAFSRNMYEEGFASQRGKSF